MKWSNQLYAKNNVKQSRYVNCTDKFVMRKFQPPQSLAKLLLIKNPWKASRKILEQSFISWIRSPKTLSMRRNLWFIAEVAIDLEMVWIATFIFEKIEKGSYAYCDPIQAGCPMRNQLFKKTLPDYRKLLPELDRFQQIHSILGAAQPPSPMSPAPICNMDFPQAEELPTRNFLSLIYFHASWQPHINVYNVLKFRVSGGHYTPWVGMEEKVFASGRFSLTFWLPINWNRHSYKVAKSSKEVTRSAEFISFLY